MRGIEVAEPGAELDIQAAIDHVYELLNAGGPGIPEARRLVGEYLAHWPGSDPLRRLARVLEPPQVIAVDGPPGPSRDREYAWLREHAHEYPGCWIAVYQDRLIAAHPRRAFVLDECDRLLNNESALLHRVPDKSE